MLLQEQEATYSLRKLGSIRIRLSCLPMICLVRESPLVSHSSKRLLSSNPSEQLLSIPSHSWLLDAVEYFSTTLKSSSFSMQTELGGMFIKNNTECLD